MVLSLVLLGCVFLGFSAYIFSNNENRTIIFNRLRFRRARRSDGSLTPPRTPEKQVLLRNDKTFDGWSNTFPPSRRYALAGLKMHGSGKSAYDLSEQPLDYTKQVLETQVPDVDALPDHVTATGFTLDEIKRLGDFPDYAALSGVPLPSAYENFDVQTAIPRPYRPFRWAYHQTMSITKMQHEWWLELESTYAQRVHERVELFEKHGPMVLQALPGSELAAKELMEMCLQFYQARHPQYFRIDTKTMTFHNHILNTVTSLRKTAPLHVLLHHVPEDFAIMIRSPTTGEYVFRGGIICSALGWNLASKIGLELGAIHGPTPDYAEKMAFSMSRYFAKKPVDKPIQRGSWGLEIDRPLFMPPYDPHEALRDAQDPTHTLDRCHLRVDWQTLRRLPLSGAVVFNFKALFTPVTEFRDEPYIPSLILKVLRHGKRNLMEYKSTWHTEHIVIPALEAYEREQIAQGIIEEGWEPHTLAESPFFPGWEEKWRRQQGF